MSKWKVYDFNEIVYDDTRNGTKVKKEHYFNRGLYPVIDQGKNLVAGYVNSSEGLYKNVPAIIFGDHTRVFKYIDFPFFLGADGVKLLKCKVDNVEYKYLYYFLLHNEIPDTGYNRHFKWLKEIKIPLPPLNIQKQIAKSLDTAAELLALRKQQLTELDHLIKSIFYEMFGDPFENPKRWGKSRLSEVATITMGQSPSGSSYNDKGKGVPLLNGPTEFGDKYPVEKQWTTKPTKICQKDDILFCVRGATAGRLNIADKEYCIGRGLASIRPKQKEMLSFIFLYLQMMNSYFQNTSNGSTFINISSDRLNNLPILKVDIDIQKRYSIIVSNIEEQKALVRKAIDETQTLFDSLMSQYFD